MLLLLGCIENAIEKNDPAFDAGDPVDTGVTDTIDTGTSDTDTSDTGSPTDTTDTGAPPDTAGDTDDSGTVPIDTGTDTTGDSGDDTLPTTTGAIAVTGRCASSSWTGWSDAAATVPELHIVGIYESDAGSPGPAYVTFTRANESTLVLTSYAAVDWKVHLASGTDVTQILVSGYDPSSTVTFTSGTTAPVAYVGWIGACAYEIPDTDPYSGCETPDLQAAVETATGLAMSSFQGCYAGGDFTIE